MAANPPIVIQLRLQGQQQVLAGTTQVSAGLRSMGVAGTRAGTALEYAGRRSFLMNQALFTMRRLAYGATLGIFGLAAAAVKLGTSYLSNMEQAKIAMTSFLGSTQAAQKELDTLYRIAALTPFEFVPLTQAAERLLAVQHNAALVNRELMDIGDASAGLGKGEEGIKRLTLAFQEMASIGVIQGRQMRMLELVGIPAGEIMRRAFHLTPDQVANIGKLHIPSNVGIEALLRGIESSPLAGMATRQRATFAGILSTLHDYTSQIMGTMLRGPYSRLEARLRGLVTGGPGNAGPDLTQAFQQRGVTGVVTTAGQAMGFGPGFNRRFIQIRDAAHAIWVVLTRELIPAFATLFHLFGGAGPVLSFIGGFFGIMARHATLMHAVFIPLVAIWLAWHTALLAASVAGRINLAVAWLLDVEGIRSARLKQLNVLWTNIQMGATYALIWAYRIWWTTMRLANIAMVWMQVNLTRTVIMQRLEAISLWFTNTALAALIGNTVLYNDISVFGYRRAIMMRIARLADAAATVVQTAATWALVAATWAWNVALDANPIMLIVLAVVALTAAFVILYWKVRPFRDFINRFWPYLIAGVFPLITVIVLLIRHWGDLVRLFEGMPGRFMNVGRAIAGIGRTIWSGLLEGFRWAINRIIDAWNWLAKKLSVDIFGVHVGLPTIGHIGSGGGGTGTTPGGGGGGAAGPSAHPRFQVPKQKPVRTPFGTITPWDPNKKPDVIHTHVHLDKKQIAEAVHEYTGDRKARK